MWSCMYVQSSLSIVHSIEWCHQPRVASAVAFSSASVNAPSPWNIGMPMPMNEASPLFATRFQVISRPGRRDFSTRWWKSFNSTFEVVCHNVVPAHEGWSICR